MDSIIGLHDGLVASAGCRRTRDRRNPLATSLKAHVVRFRWLLRESDDARPHHITGRVACP